MAIEPQIPFTLKDVGQLEANIKELMPKATFHRFDYNFGLAVHFDGHILVACQPQRFDPECRDGKQHAFILSAEAVVAAFSASEGGKCLT